MARILPKIKAPDIPQAASKMSQSQNSKLIRRQICEPIDIQCLLEVAGVVALHDAARNVLLDPVDAAAALHGRPGLHAFRPSDQMRILVDAQELPDVDVPAERVGPVPGEDREVGDRDMVAKNEGAVGEATVQYVHLALGLHRVAVD